ncbi:hypothetical protein PHPALM_28991 [Phytophthora palmivora]|uniref:Uncharacterized protein n=1 Tax=Phytophthora palmivora TaxID=4796 RepID=A0A2P4X8P5_9STRA|nr:hypothetical protein PHPALM_28991 [Phytophthora palmivora]
MIPRDFFVVETNAVVLPQKYPANQYKSTLNAQGQWQTVVFPALTPHTRQQVLYLRQTLDKMRATMPKFDDVNESVGPETETDACVLAERRRLMIEYTCQETQIYSHCFHELARQIKCICKEQSELLHEIRVRYDVAVARLIDHVKLSDQQNNQQQDQLADITTKYQLALEERKQLVQRVEELENQVKCGPPVVAMQEVLKRTVRGKVCSQPEENDTWGEDESEIDIDEEEAEWRRQRDEASISRPLVVTKHDSTKDLHLASTQLQAAFQKYQARKEQTRVTLDVEKQAAALDIQRSFRGFRERQMVLHRRAIMRTILRRREENAAVELMQANVRAYLLNRRRKPGKNSKPSARQALIRLLKTFRELASVISMFQNGEGQNEEGMDTDENNDSSEVQNEFLPRPESVTPSELLDEEDVQLFQLTMQEAQALVGSLHVVLGTVPEEKSETQRADMDSRSDGCDDYGDSSLNISFGERDAIHLQNYTELHLDDSLWSSAAYYPATKNDISKAESLLALALASREQRKRLVALKQFISDIYDTIVGKLKELPSWRLAEMTTSRCQLTLSFMEWRQQRAQLFSRAVGADQPSEQATPVIFSIDQLIKEHFRCRLGLQQLIDAALANFLESIEDFSVVDPDVKRFQEFMLNERSEEELVFCCMCRYLCAHRLSSDESPAGTASSSYHRQPMFHPLTMREVMDVPHALELAKLLFRVDDESLIVESDSQFTEVENAVYRQYLPTNGYHQFESIVSSYFVDPDTQAAAVSAINDASDGDADTLVFFNTCKRPSVSPRHVSAMARPTNYNQFHAKQYNSQAARSPIVRRQQRPSQMWSPTSGTVGEPRWVFFEEVLALLIKYRGEMNHFHLFSYWVQELFGLAASKSSTASTQSKLLDESAFVETLTPLSLGPTERELRNIFHNSLRQRKLQVFMSLRVFTSVALLLLRNGLLSVSIYAPMQKPTSCNGEAREVRQRSLSIREENEDKEWRTLALKWRTQESAFEAAIEAIYHEPLPAYKSTPDDQTSDSNTTSIDKTRAAHALQLLQLRQELYDLFASRSGRGRDLKRAHEIYKILVNERLARVGGDTNLLDTQVGPFPTRLNSFMYY